MCKFNSQSFGLPVTMDQTAHLAKCAKVGAQLCITWISTRILHGLVLYGEHTLHAPNFEQIRPLQILSPAADVFRDVVDLLVFESGPINAAKLQCSSYGFTSLMEADRRIGRLGWSLSINSSLARDDI
ncbi:hypothetical protein ECG_08732 [Echinococcus granulosus]|nr:hypothetical protein ECG_08732 [Echinococcus granulosus]